MTRHTCCTRPEFVWGWIELTCREYLYNVRGLLILQRKDPLRQARVEASIISVHVKPMRESPNLLIYSPMALDGSSIRQANGRSQPFLSFRSVAFGVEKPLLAGYITRISYSRQFSNIFVRSTLSRSSL